MSLKMAPFDRPYDFLLVRHCKYSSIWYCFWVISTYLTLNDIMTLKFVRAKRSLKVVQTGTIQKLGYGFLLAFHSNYGSILHHLQHKASYWSKIVIFFIPLLHSTPPLRGCPSEYCHPVRVQKTLFLKKPNLVGFFKISVCSARCYSHQMNV